MALPTKVIIEGVETDTQKMCPVCNRRLRFGIQSIEKTCIWYCETGDYTSQVQSYENVTYTDNMPWRMKEGA